MKFAGLILTSAAALLTLAAPAVAQLVPNSSGGGLPTPGIEIGADHVDPATKEKRREIERAYQNATQKIPAQAAATNDPWANMRGPNETRPAPAVKPAKSAQKKKTPAQ